jgi:MFS family permease
VIVIVLWNTAIYLDSSALTAGTLNAAEKEHRGATMGLHSMCGYAGGFIGPPLAGLVLDLIGRDTVTGWGFAFGHLAVITLTGLVIVRYFNRVPVPSVAAEAA